MLGRSGNWMTGRLIPLLQVSENPLPTSGLAAGPTNPFLRAGNSVVVTLPSQLAELADLAVGDIVEFDYLGRGALRIAKRQGPER